VYYLESTAWVRGRNWAGRVAAKVGTAKPWPPYEGRAAAIARERVADLEPGGDERILDALARACHTAAAKRWNQLR